MNYTSTANIEEVMKFYNLGDKTFETDFSNSVINGHTMMKFCTVVAHDKTIPYTKLNSEIYTDVIDNDVILFKEHVQLRFGVQKSPVF